MNGTNPCTPAKPGDLGYLDPESSEAESIRTIQRALDLGVTHIDTAEIYGASRVGSPVHVLYSLRLVPAETSSRQAVTDASGLFRSARLACGKPGRLDRESTVARPAGLLGDENDLGRYDWMIPARVPRLRARARSRFP